MQELKAAKISARSQSRTDRIMLKKNAAVDIENGSATVSEATSVISGVRAPITEKSMSKEAENGVGSDGNHVASLIKVPYIGSAQNDEVGLSEHVQTRGRYIREHFATLLHALRISELLTVKAIKMFKDYTADLFNQENGDGS